MRLILSLSGLLLALSAVAQQSVPAEPAAEPPAAEPESVPDPAPARPAAPGPTPQRFAPSEEVRADFAVSFPIDI
ncbi:MAG: hypothetical protein ACO3LH_09500 [Steroidobacteraceae bacterium]